MRELLLLLIIVSYLQLGNHLDPNMGNHLDPNMYIWIKQQKDRFIGKMRYHIVSKMPRRYRILMYYKLIDTFCSKTRILTMLITFTIIPRLIVGISLSIDVYYYGRIYILYKTLVLLIIPIIFKIIISLLHHEVRQLKDITAGLWLKLVLLLNRDERLMYTRIILIVLQLISLIHYLSIL
jgi:hypothetical protein